MVLPPVYLALLLILAARFAVGLAVRTPAGRQIPERGERSHFGRLPGYAVVRSLARRLAGAGTENVRKPALVEVEEAPVPAFIVEELDEGGYTVFLPSLPTPLAGAGEVRARERVHPIDVPLPEAPESVARWGSGAKDLGRALQPGIPPPGCSARAPAPR
jgi:uncharacterized membrane protein